MSPVRSNPSWRQFPQFMSIAKFVSNILFGVISRTDPQVITPVSTKVEDIISRIIALEELFGTPAGDVAEQRRRGALIWYATVPPSCGFCTEFFPGISVKSKQNFRCCTGSQRRSNSKIKGIYPSFSKIYGRRYLIIGLVHSPNTHIDADEDNSWHNRDSSTLKSIS